MTTVAFSKTLPGSGITRASRTANTVGRRAPGRSAAGSKPRVRSRRARTAVARQRLRFIEVYPRQEWRTEGEPENRIGEAKGKCKKKWGGRAGPPPPFLPAGGAVHSPPDRRSRTAARTSSGKDERPTMETPPPDAWVLAEQTHAFVRSQRWEVAVLPFGATEPHNLHMPYGTDNFQVEAIARRACGRAYEAGARV